jgi:hypothetical protein
MKPTVLIIICIVILFLLYEFVPTCKRPEFGRPKSLIKRDDESHIVMSLSDTGVAHFYAVPKSEIDQMKPVNYNRYVYYFFGDGIHKKLMGARNTLVVLDNNSAEAKLVTNVRGGKYRLVHSEPNYSHMSSIAGISSKDYDLVIRTAH